MFENRKGVDSLKKTQKYTAGLISGLSRPIFSHPLDVVKTRLQTNRLVYSRNTPVFMFKIWKNEGFLKLYSGVLPSFTSSAINSMIFWPVYLNLEKYFKKRFNKEGFSPYVVVPSTAIAWFSSTIFSSPLQYVKVKMQVRKDRGLWSVVRHSKIKSFYHGFVPLQVISLAIVFNFMFYGKIKKKLYEYFNTESIFATIGASIASFSISASFLYPVDRIMNVKRVVGEDFRIMKFVKDGKYYTGFRQSLYIGIISNVAMFSILDLMRKMFEFSNSKKKNKFGK